MKQMSKISIAMSIGALLITGCSDKPTEQERSVKAETVQNSAQTTSVTPPKTIYGASAQQTQAKVPTEADMQLNTPHIAKVLETMNGGGYTYAKVDEKGNIYWIAGPQSNITVGTSISFIEQMVMTEFTSKALNKTFDQLVFVSAIVGSDKSGAAMPNKDDAHKNCNHDKELKLEPANTATTATAPTPIKIAKNANGYSVEELYAKKDSLNGKSIKIDAKVVKISRNIMGKDWIHLQDGSGSAGTNDIIATSKNSTINVGDSVTTDGVIKTNIDLGYGYKFPVIIEEAKFTSIK